MKIALILLMLTANYYTFTYAKSLWQDDNNKLAALGVAVLTFFGTVLPIYMLFFRSI